MARIVDPRQLPDPKIRIPGLKPPVREFTPSDDSDPSEADAFNRMIRELRNLDLFKKNHSLRQACLEAVSGLDRVHGAAVGRSAGDNGFRDYASIDDLDVVPIR
jgi:hypothetical protein